MSDVTKKSRQIVRVEGKAEKKNQAFSNALNQIHGKVLKESDDVTLRIEPIDTKIVLAEEERYTEKFLFFFLPRTRVNYRVVLDVEIEITLISVNEVQFATTNVTSPTALPLPSFKKNKLPKEEI
ncbi:DUF4312 family protein [Carnobacterium gallinarum]|uniref:DUF4312 family protein n=1 Tax=Carnobacterium gallinarum TaxID=2749 RepID=UPI0005553CC3|nr:DUF4312 family protein [Carnobacterium gallinarum]